MQLPDYKGGSIVNLMSSLILSFGGEAKAYPPLYDLDLELLRQSKNVILLIIDGLGYDYLKQYGSGSVLHEHLTGHMTSVFPSTTATAVTTFMTGAAPQQHGLTGWFTYLKELGCISAVIPFRPRYGGSTFGSLDINAVSLYGNIPVFDRIDVNSYVIAPEWIVHSDFNVAHSGRAHRRGYNTLNEFFDIITKTVNEDKERKYLYAYWPDFDRYSHEFGNASDETAKHFSELDEAFGQFLKRLSGTGTTLIVTADHGFIDTDPDTIIEMADHPVLSNMLTLPLCGEPRVAYCYIHPDKGDQFKEYVENELSEITTLHESKQLVAQNYFGMGAPHPRLLERIGHYTLIMKQNYVLKDWLEGEQRHVHIGVHGGVSSEEMLVPLIISYT